MERQTMSGPVEGESPTWAHIFHTKFYRYRALLGKYWWIVVFTSSVGIAVGAWQVAKMATTYVSTARMMVSGKINLPEGATYSEEMNFFMNTQRELMQDEAVRQRAEARLRKANPELVVSPVELSVAPLPQTSIFVLTAQGLEPNYAQKFLDAVMQEFIATRHEMRTEKSEDAESSIEEEISRVQADLKKEEERGLAFQRDNNVGFLEQEGNSAGAFLAKLNTRLAELKQESQLLNLFELDQKIARDESRMNSPGNGAAVRETENNRELNGAQLEYLRARQQIEVLRAEQASYAKDLRPEHPIMVALEGQIGQQKQLIETFRKQSAADLERRREAARLEIQNVESTVKEWEGKALALSQKLAEYNTIQAGIVRKRNQLESLSRSKGNVEINRNVDQEVVSIRQKASPPVARKPGIAGRVSSAFGFGLLAGLVCLALIDRLDDRVASVSEFQSYFGGRILAQIPSVPQGSDHLGTVPLVADESRHAFAEAFRSLRSSLLFLPTDAPRSKVILITSAVPNEGKSTVALNFAITLASANARVLLVDGDLRRGELHRAFDLGNSVGLGDVLTEKCSLESAVQVTPIAGLSLLARGAGVQNPGELYLSAAAERFLAQAHELYDYVILDSSPVMAADDTTSLAPKADATMFVFRFTSSSTRTSRKAMDLLDERQANLIGVICNDVSEAMQEYYYYRYSEYYGTDGGKEASKRQS